MDFEFENFIYVIIVIVVMVAAFLFGSIKTIKSGEVGIKTRFGKVVSTEMTEGINLKLPFVEKIEKMNTRVQIYENEIPLSTSTKDLQVINNIIIDVNYQLDASAAPQLYREVGKAYQGVVISPAIQESVKSTISQYTAEELVTKRSEVANAINDNLINKLRDKYGINILATAIKNFDFSQEYNSAIEQKAVAEQQVLTSKQLQEKAKVEAETKRIQAEGDAAANREIQQSLTKDILTEKFINKWNGELPKVSGGEGIFNIDSFVK